METVPVQWGRKACDSVISKQCGEASPELQDPRTRGAEKHQPFRERGALQGSTGHPQSWDSGDVRLAFSLLFLLTQVLAALISLFLKVLRCNLV